MSTTSRAVSVAFLSLLLGSPACFAQSGTWTNVQPPAAPSFRAQGGLATDPFTGITVLFGGSSTTTTLDETWIFDGCSWSLVPAAVKPSPRTNAYMAASPNPGRVVLFGGHNGTALDTQTWEFDVLTLTWSNVTPGGASPPLRQVHAMAYDSFRNQTVLFGGATASYGVLGDTWEWDGYFWNQRAPLGGVAPAARGWHSLAFDASRGRTVLFGGYDNASQRADTWEWDGAQWTAIATPASPSPRSSIVTAWDPETRRVLLFGGSQGWPFGLGDTWEYDGTTWSPVTLVGPAPAPQYLQRTASDPVRGGVLLFGAYGNNWAPLGETWRYRRASLTASTLAPPPGTTVSFALTLPGEAGYLYQAAASFSGSCPGVLLPTGRAIPLNFDPITSLSISGQYPQIFQGFGGVLDSSGSAAFALALPPLPALSGTPITIAAVTLSGSIWGSAPNGLTLLVP